MRVGLVSDKWLWAYYDEPDNSKPSMSLWAINKDISLY